MVILLILFVTLFLNASVYLLYASLHDGNENVGIIDIMVMGPALLLLAILILILLPVIVITSRQN